MNILIYITKYNNMVLVGLLFLSIVGNVAASEASSLKGAFSDRFLIGAAVNQEQILGHDAKALEVIDTHFNSLTAENEMKWERVQAEEGVFTFETSDALVKMGEAKGLAIIGHTLLWHSQTPDWVFEGRNGKPATRKLLLKRLRKHIQKIMGRYKGRVHGWDVVNEAFNEDGTWRDSPWYRIIGPDYIEKAFEYAREADPDTELYYNDYNLFKAEKRNAVVRLVDALKAKGIKIDGIGIQGHYGVGYPPLDALEASIEAFARTGAQVMITELDISALPFPDTDSMGADISLNFELKAELDPFTNGISEEKEQELADSYLDLFRLLLENEKSVSRVTLWGISDRDTWRNNWPMAGRTDYPLLFDRGYRPKSVVQGLIALAKETE